jgi:RNase P subunit RPR2
MHAVVMDDRIIFRSCSAAARYLMLERGNGDIHLISSNIRHAALENRGRGVAKSVTAHGHVWRFEEDENVRNKDKLEVYYEAESKPVHNKRTHCAECGEMFFPGERVKITLGFEMPKIGRYRPMRSFTTMICKKCAFKKAHEVGIILTPDIERIS